MPSRWSPSSGSPGRSSSWTHDVFSLLAVVVGFAIYWAELRRRGWLNGRIALVSLGVLLGGILGARIVTGWESVDDMGRAIDAGTPVSYALMHGNKSVVGAMIGGYLGGVLTKRSLGYSRSTGDAYVLALPIAMAIGRVGCFLTELPLGTATTLPWGMTVDPSAAAEFPRCPDCDLPMHPSMLYEIGFNLLAIPILIWARPRVPVQGDLLKAYLLSAAIFRLAWSSSAATRCRRSGSRVRNWCWCRASSCLPFISCARHATTSIACPPPRWHREASPPPRRPPTCRKGVETMTQGPPPAPEEQPNAWAAAFEPPPPASDIETYLRTYLTRYTRDALDRQLLRAGHPPDAIAAAWAAIDAQDAAVLPRIDAARRPCSSAGHTS